MDIAVPVCLWMFGSEYIHLVELLCTLRTVLEHGTHCGIAVYVSVLTLYITISGSLECKILIDLHKACIHFSYSCSVCSVKNICLGCLCMTALNKYLFYSVLYFLYSRKLTWFTGVLLKIIANFLSHFSGFLIIVTADSSGCFIYSIGYLLNVERYCTSVPLLNFSQHLFLPLVEIPRHTTIYSGERNTVNII